MEIYNFVGIILLDEAADTPSFANWDPGVSRGEIPLVFYEALHSCLFRDNNNSQQLNDYIDKIVKEKGWSEDDIFRMTDQVNVFFGNGKKLSVMAEFGDSQNLTSAFSGIYDFGDDWDIDKRVFFDGDEAEFIMNLKNVAMIEAPLVQVEDRCCAELEEMLGE